MLKKSSETFKKSFYYHVNWGKKFTFQKFFFRISDPAQFSKDYVISRSKKGITGARQNYPSRMSVAWFDLLCPNSSGYRVHARKSSYTQERSRYRQNAHYAEVKQVYPSRFGMSIFCIYFLFVQILQISFVEYYLGWGGTCSCPRVPIRSWRLFYR